jgi:NAD(P)H-nitrite reductase large subunit
MDEKEILDRLKPICLCKAIRKAAFLKHIAAGKTTIEGLKRATGAGTGSCEGKRCTERIAELLNGRPSIKQRHP